MKKEVALVSGFSLLVILVMVTATSWASFETNVFEGFRDLFRFRWGVATLGDTYFGFLTVYLWIAYKESTWTSRLLWLVLVLCFGTIATSSYLLFQISKLKSGDGVEHLLLRKQG
jgi:hypothetical protein